MQPVFSYSHGAELARYASLSGIINTSMTPKNREESGFGVPQPGGENELPKLAPVEAAPVQSEVESRNAELPGTALAEPTQDSPQTGKTPSPLIDDPIPAASASTPITAPGMADDADLIEKEWVDKAKAIVNHTRDDPHQQNKKLNQFKADYMKKRYSKEIRLSDES